MLLFFYILLVANRKVRNYQRKSDRQNWSADNMKRAIEQILSDAMGYKKAQTYMVPESTLEDRIKKMKKNGLSLEEASLKGMGKYKCVFLKEQEIELVGYVQLMESRLFGFTTTELRLITQYQIGALFGKAYNKAPTIQIAESGIRQTGIYTTDKYRFNEADFALPSVTSQCKELYLRLYPISRL
ncbi:hypothetical protein RN001_000337 [Aquatica leii]|uniref:HTH psq-type domain-containing protein n=1 Tax=Aquatica leii TaxID=1421715 RepID=A0AAN7PK02_9COLE|nr:hypothetical protein RN001_000337 [Aquatica leii]